MENSVNDPEVFEVLQDVSTDGIVEFKKDLKKDFPNTIHIFSFIHVILEWKKKRQDLNASILAPFGDPNEGVIVFVVTHNTFNGTVYAKDVKCAEKLQEYLKESKRIPYLTKEMTLFTCMTETSFKAVEKITSGPGWCINHDTVYWLPWYVAREMDVTLPEDVEVRMLCEKYAEQINSVWPHRFDGSLQLIKDMIDVNFGFGAFRGKQLVSWALFWFYGGIGVLQTEEAEKRKGYARAVVEAMTKHLGDVQFDVHLNVVSGNTAANAFFQALGFRFAFSSVWASRGLYKKPVDHPVTE